MLDDAAATARSGTYGPSEVSWVEHLHALIALNLEGDVRRAIRAAGETDSVHVDTGFIHGNPFKIRASSPVDRPVEAGDILVIGERFDNTDSLMRREALLLQMKVGSPKWSSRDASTRQQALLYGAWPPVEWMSAALRSLPGVHPRTPKAAPCRAAQFGIIPTYRSAGAFEALSLHGPGIFGGSCSLAAELAAVTQLAIGGDATPGPTDGWPRIVQDMLERSLELTYARRTPRHSRTLALAAKDHGDADLPPEPAEDVGRGRFLTVVVQTGPQGVRD